jgi:hypothetical protein
MPQNLTDQNIDDTYGGIIHAGGQELPTEGQVALCDGMGNLSSLKIGKKDRGATIYGSSGEEGTTIFGDLSATQRATVGHLEALSGTTSQNIAKAFCTFNPSSQQIITKYGIKNVVRSGTGQYQVKFDDDVTAMLGDDQYSVHATMTINHSDITPLLSFIPAVFVTDSPYTNEGSVDIRCIKYTTSIEYFDPRYVHIAIYKA